MNERPRVLIEDWLPVNELGIESRRERGAASALPPLSFLHVWWARRPLAASVAVVLAGVLPAWSDETRAILASILCKLAPGERQNVLRPRKASIPPPAYTEATEDWYHDWFLHLCGVWGDPVAGRQAIDRANLRGERLVGNGYGYKQSFRNGLDRTNVEVLHQLLRRTWGGGELPLVLDSTAGGGSIPFAAARLGIPAHANDLNGVAAAILAAGVKAPAEHGQQLNDELKTWGGKLIQRTGDRLRPYFPLQGHEQVIAYIHANTVRCPRTGNTVPLATDFWLRKGAGKEVAVEMVTEVNGTTLHEPRFTLVKGKGASAVAARGTMSRGDAISPYDHLVIDGDYIKTEAQAGRMGQVLYAVSIRDAGGRRDFRTPTQADLDALTDAVQTLDSLAAEWDRQDLLPREEIPAESNYDRGHRLYGLRKWADFFTPRQLLTHGVFADEYRKLIPEVRRELGHERGDAVLALLALMQGKAVNWNGRQSSWNVGAQGMRSVFDKHNFAFKWTFAEFDGVALYHWALDQLTDAYGGIVALLDGTGSSLEGDRLERHVTVTQGNAANIPSLPSGSVVHLCVDPPYYNNVMYAELADYFYVWEKRTLGLVQPEFFSDELTDKENEAVANQARFADMGRRKKDLADADYEAKMTAIFAEAHRVLRDDGVLSVMFTHKRAEAWDTLGMALLQAGFTVETSWPVNTESEHSLHQAQVNAAASTIMLVCRKRPDATSTGQVFFEDIEADVRREARTAVERFTKAGLTGVDLLLSTYGPALSVISAAWPVYSSHATADGGTRLLRPEEALTAARAEVIRLQRSRLVGHAANLDALSDFVLIAWDTFKAHEFPFDDARRLALAVGGLDMDELKRAKILELKSGTARLMEPKERVRRDDGNAAGVRPGASSFGSLIDAVHTVMYVTDVDGLPAAKVLMDRLGLAKDAGFISCVQGLVNSIPRVRVKGAWTAPEADTLDRLVGAYLTDEVTLPPVVDPSESEPERLF